MNHEAFQEFLKSEIKTRHLSVREFAALVGVSHTTILRFIEYEPAKSNVPTLEFLEKLASATGISLNTILALCFPETAKRLEIDPDLAIICEEVAQLPIIARQAVLRFIRSFNES